MLSQAKGKSKAYDPFASTRPKKVKIDTSAGPSTPTLVKELMELDPSLNANAMAPSALLLTLRRKTTRTEAARQIPGHPLHTASVDAQNRSDDIGKGERGTKTSPSNGAESYT